MKFKLISITLPLFLGLIACSNYENKSPNSTDIGLAQFDAISYATDKYISSFPRDVNDGYTYVDSEKRELTFDPIGNFYSRSECEPLVIVTANDLEQYDNEVGGRTFKDFRLKNIRALNYEKYNNCIEKSFKETALNEKNFYIFTNDPKVHKFKKIYPEIATMIGDAKTDGNITVWEALNIYKSIYEKEQKALFEGI